MELLDTESEDTTVGGCRDRESERERQREGISSSEKWSTYVERYSAPLGQTSPKDIPTSVENDTAANHPVSSDQAGRGGRGRKRKNADINKKV